MPGIADLTTVWCFNVTGLERGIALDLTSDGVRYEKELIYEGSFVKKLPGTPAQRFTVTPDVIRHWKKTIQDQNANGVKVALPTSHANLTDENQGYVLDARVGRDSKGRIALYGECWFKDQATADKFVKTSDVSIFTQPEFTDGKGNEYKGPVRHVCLTTEPVIPGLDGWERVAASFESGEPGMNEYLKKLAAMLGIDVAADDTDETLFAKLEPLVDSGEDTEGDGSVPPLNDDPNDPENQDQKNKKPAGQVPPGIAASFTRTLNASRKTALSQLVKDGNITKAVADDLEREFCAPEVLALSMEHSSLISSFDRLVETLSKNKPVTKGERSGAAIPLELSLDDRQTSKNPLVAEAERRAALAAKK